MKKQIIIALAGCMVLSLSACGSSEEKSISGSVQNIVTENNAGNETDAVNEVASEADDTDENATFVFEYQGITMEIDGGAEEYVEKLGEPISYYEATSCAFGDLDKIYRYSGFEMDTYQTEGHDYVSGIIFQDDSISTPEGLSLGDDSAKIIETYGEPTTEDNGSYIYVRDNMKLCFIVNDGEIASIQYLSTILD